MTSHNYDIDDADAMTCTIWAQIWVQICADTTCDVGDVTSVRLPVWCRFERRWLAQFDAKWWLQWGLKTGLVWSELNLVRMWNGLDRLTQLKHFVTSHNLSVEALSSFIQRIQLAVGPDNWFGLACFSYNIQFEQADATWHVGVFDHPIFNT